MLLAPGGAGQPDVNAELRRFQVEQIEQWNVRWGTFVTAWNHYALAANRAAQEVDARSPRALDAEAVHRRHEMLLAWRDFEKLACDQKRVKQLGAWVRTAGR